MKIYPVVFHVLTCGSWMEGHIWHTSRCILATFCYIYARKSTLLEELHRLWKTEVHYVCLDIQLLYCSFYIVVFFTATKWCSSCVLCIPGAFVYKFTAFVSRLFVNVIYRTLLASCWWPRELCVCGVACS